MKNKIFQSRDLCLRALDTNLLCAKNVRRNGEKMTKKLKAKKNKGYVILIICILAVLAAVAVLLYRFFIGSVTVRDGGDGYCNFEGFKGYSNLEIFPSNPGEISEVTEYYYRCADTLMDPTCKIYMVSSFSDDEMFEKECLRLSNIMVENAGQINEIQYSETLFNYPAYIAMYDWSSCYEYALVSKDEKKIVYVFLQGDSQKVDEKYMPIHGGNDDAGFSIYSFDGSVTLKYR